MILDIYEECKFHKIPNNSGYQNRILNKVGHLMTIKVQILFFFCCDKH